MTRIQDIISGHEKEKDLLSRLQEAQKKNSPQKDQLKNAWSETCLDNLKIVHSYVKQHGWPSAATHGAKAEHAAWLCAQHGEANFTLPRDKWNGITAIQGEILDAMRKGNAEPGYTAFLTDRVRRNKGEPQLYATQIAPHPDFPDRLKLVESPETLDQRRMNMGLGETAEQYMKRLKTEFDVGLSPLPFRKVIEKHQDLLAEYEKPLAPALAAVINYRADWSQQSRNSGGYRANITPGGKQ